MNNFIWKNVIYRFGVPKEIVSDNGSQFISFEFQDFYGKWNIKLNFSTPRFPQSNGQAKSSNKTIIATLKKRLEQAKGRWAEKIPRVLWSFRTTTRTSTRETPFSLAYGTEAVIPVETGIPTSIYEWATNEQNWQELNHEQDTIDERREKALVRIAAYQQSVA